MSDSGYQHFLKLKANHAEQHKQLIQGIKKAEGIPQWVLMDKTVSDAIMPDGQQGTVTIDDKFYFTEPCVNRLLWFCTKKAHLDIDQKSYQDGYNSAMKDVAKKLDLYTEQDLHDQTSSYCP